MVIGSKVEQFIVCEIEVVKLVVWGLFNVEIVEEFVVFVVIVKIYVFNCFMKCDLCDWV